jgi:hypothetical protein
MAIPLTSSLPSRPRGFEAQQRAAQTYEEEIREALQDVAADWFMLAELMDCLQARD